MQSSGVINHSKDVWISRTNRTGTTETLSHARDFNTGSSSYAGPSDADRARHDGVYTVADLSSAGKKWEIPGDYEPIRDGGTSYRAPTYAEVAHRHRFNYQDQFPDLGPFKSHNPFYYRTYYEVDGPDDEHTHRKDYQAVGTYGNHRTKTFTAVVRRPRPRVANAMGAYTRKRSAATAWPPSQWPGHAAMVKEQAAAFNRYSSAPRRPHKRRKPGSGGGVGPGPGRTLGQEIRYNWRWWEHHQKRKKRRQV